MVSRAAFYRTLLFLTPIFVLYLFLSKIDTETIKIGTKNLIDTINLQKESNPTEVSKSANPIITTEATSPSTSSTPSTVASPTTAAPVLTTNSSLNASDQPKEAFVTFSNNQPTYLALLKVFLDSVHAFSTRPVIAYGIDVDLDIDLKQYPRVIKRRIAQSDCGPVRYFSIPMVLCFYS